MVSRDSRLKTTVHAPLDVEPKDLNAIVIFSIDRLFASIELFTLVDILSTGIASPGYAISNIK